ncbi:helix-turn-helix domain-containing protein [Solihabitans fulvus]|uniref:Helix-turn-helix domain-containing protein n=1 Tax=Solihabitans fulvus TaxID=1892852 RepID=A0A5B2WRL2_9PSEU|nr:Scr1 family TA system antitoxin-like transcriptional regulator [Solihabitans fulvus]KAA2253322.1 helix-turn-helix domain-containing protein [Solihabitans fulvus]
MRTTQSLRLHDMLTQALQRLRSQATLTSPAVAAATGMSQSKVSKIENGKLLPAIDDVAVLAQALGADEKTTGWLLETIAALRADAAARVVVLHRGPDRHHRAIARAAADATTTRTVATLLVPDLLRTDTYHEALQEPDLPAPHRRAALTSLRHRQRLLEDPDRRFEFVLPAAVLDFTVRDARTMTGQIHRLRTLAGHPNISIAVIPTATPVATPLEHPFSVYDLPAQGVRQEVVVELLTGTAHIIDTMDIQAYQEIYDALARLTVGGARLRPLLDQAHARYAETLTGGTP